MADADLDAGSPPVAGGPVPSGRAWWRAALYVLTAAMLLRFYDLPLKPLHHDEGVNGLFLTNLVRPPHAYRYDPSNYHGPTLYYFAWLSVMAAGVTTVAIRAVTAVAGWLAVMLLLGLRRQIGGTGALAAAALFALSPGAVYFSRYFIHEMLLVCFTLATVVALAAWWQRRRAVFLHLAAAAAALTFATKETVIIHSVVMAGALAGAVALYRWRAEPAGSAAAFLRRLGTNVTAAGRELFVRLTPGRLLLLQALAVFVAVSLLFFTSLFTHWQGAVDALRSFAIWTKTGTSAHTRPWYAYLEWLGVEESPLLVLGGAGAVWALWKAENRFAMFAALWSIGSLTAYSAIPYKTPWLALNVIAPLAISAGYGFEQLWQHRLRLPRLTAQAIALVAAAVAAFQAVSLNFIHYDDNRYPYVYVHTSREALALVRQIGQIEQVNPGATIAVTSRDHFPLSWYLRAYHVGYYGRPTVTGDALVIASAEQVAKLHPQLIEKYEQAGSFNLRPGVQLFLYVRRDLRRPPAAASPPGTR